MFLSVATTHSHSLDSSVSAVIVSCQVTVNFVIGYDDVVTRIDSEGVLISKHVPHFSFEASINIDNP